MVNKDVYLMVSLCLRRCKNIWLKITLRSCGAQIIGEHETIYLSIRNTDKIIGTGLNVTLTPYFLLKCWALSPVSVSKNAL